MSKVNLTPAAETANNNASANNAKTEKDAKTRELAVTAKAKAEADKKVISQITKKAETILAKADVKAKAEAKATKGKKEIVKADKKGKTEKKAPKITFVSELDKILQAGGTWKELVEATEALNVKMNGHIKYNASVLKAHIRFRTTTSIHKNPNYLGKLVITDNGIELPKAKKVSRKVA